MTLPETLLMHCPNCGQQQISAETKFCSRCGLQLGLVAELLQHGGTLPQLESIERKKTFLNKKNGVGFGFLWLVFFLFLTAVWGILDAEELAGICAVTGVFGFIAILVGSLIMLPSSRGVFRQTAAPSAQNVQPAALHARVAPEALPPRQHDAAEVYSAPQGSWRAPDTGELIERGSVVENTTKLLNREE